MGEVNANYVGVHSFVQFLRASKYLLIIFILAFIVNPVFAKEAEIEKSFPAWATPSCIETFYKIVQHESGNTEDDEVFTFVAEQIIRDITIRHFDCNSLTNWRWSVGFYPMDKVSNQVRISVLMAIVHYPDFKYSMCNFIGMQTDIPVWNSYGYDTTIGFKKTIGNLTVVGVGCKH